MNFGNRHLLVVKTGDGVALHSMGSPELDMLLRDPMGSFGVMKFRNGLDGGIDYWSIGDALLLETETVVPVPVVTAWRLP
jgi:hypothetical protein